MDSNAVNVAEVYSRLSKLSSTSFGRKIFGHLAQPVLANLQEIEYKKLEDEDDDSDLKDPPSSFKKISEAFLHNFAWGDLFSLAGATLLGIQTKLFPNSAGDKPGFIEKSIRTLALIITFGGSMSAMFGRMFDMHKKVALGDKYADAKLKSAERKGKRIFSEYDSEQIKSLIQEADKLDKILIYKQGLRESILERHAKEDIGGLLDGPPGTGKTAGVKCILGKWAKKNLEAGIQPVIAELNLAEFDDYLKETNQNTAEITEALQVTAGLGSPGQVSLTHGEGLLILELLIKKIQKLVNKVNRHNDTHTNKQKLAIFIDEFDKIFDPRTLKGCDKLRLKNLLVQFNELFIKTNILLTSNTLLEDMIKEIRQQLRSNDGHDAVEIWKPMYNRISSKNRAYVDRPGPEEQAEIIAARILKSFSENLDLVSFGISTLPNNNNELARKLLADPIKVITKKLNLKLDGRQLSYACDDLITMLLGKARELKVEQNISDHDWEKLSNSEKIRRTGAKIDIKLLATTLSNKAMGDRSTQITEITEQDQANKQTDANHKLISSILKTANDLVQRKGNTSPEEIITALHHNYNLSA